MREIAALQRPPAAAADTIANKWAFVLNRLGHGREITSHGPAMSRCDGLIGQAAKTNPGVLPCDVAIGPSGYAPPHTRVPPASVAVWSK
jgi:hypothetical protein